MKFCGDTSLISKEKIFGYIMFNIIGKFTCKLKIILLISYLTKMRRLIGFGFYCGTWLLLESKAIFASIDHNSSIFVSAKTWVLLEGSRVFTILKFLETLIVAKPRHIID